MRRTLLVIPHAHACHAATPKSDHAKQKAALEATFLNKPVVLAGRTSTGGKFSTADLKGKIILVEFWGAWCPDCQAAAPTMRDLYAKYHDKAGGGVEFVGVNCDKSDAACNDFTTKQKLPWVELREDKEVTMHPLADHFGVWWVPTIWIIDKDGILRAIDTDTNPGPALDKLLQ